MVEDLMNNFVKAALLGSAITVGGAGVTVLYNEHTPPAAAYFQEVQVAPPVKQDKDPVQARDIMNAPGQVSGIVDVKKTPIPEMNGKILGSTDQTSNTEYNFGLVHK